MKTMSPLIKPIGGDQRRLGADRGCRPVPPLITRIWFITGDMVFIVRYLHDKTSRASERVRNTSSKCPGTLGKFLEAFGGFESRLEVSVSREPDIGYAALSSGERAI